MHAFVRARRRRGTTIAASLTAVLATALTTVITVLPTSTAQALEPAGAAPAAGPIDPNTGYPFWYADATGEKFELCLDRPDTKAGLCQAAPQNPDARPWVDEDPELSNLAEDPETFWYSADAVIRQNGVRARFVAAQEATFGGADGSARATEQIAFGRVRVVLRGMVPGASYTVTHPYGTDTYTADDRGRVFVTEDIGCFDVPCDFTKPYDSSVTSYLRWDPKAGAQAPGGYVGDPGVPHEVVGAPSGNNFFRVVGLRAGGPGVNSIETNLFNVQGKLWKPTQPMLGLDSAQNQADFGKVMQGVTQVATQTVTLTNAGGGTTPLQLGQLTVGGADSAKFTIANDHCSAASLLPGELCTVDVSYAPLATDLGPVRARLVVPSNGKDSDGGQWIPLRARVSDGTGKDARITGPISTVHGFPEWYQDETGQRVALCDDPDDDMCVLPDVPEGTYDPALPMSFPGNFPGELFWWNADAAFDTTNTASRPNTDVSAQLVLAEEAAFAFEDAAPGEQVAFGRIRIRVDGLVVGGEYDVTTPYGNYHFTAADDGKGGGEINYTEDIGCLENPCNFDRVNQSNIGPFLRQVNAPEGYLGNPNVPAKVTGGLNGVNEFRISGPGVTGGTDQFAVSGKLLAGPATSKLSASSSTVRVNPGSGGTDVTLTNLGDVPAKPTASVDSDLFTVIKTDCPAELLPGKSCNVTVGVAKAKPGETALLIVMDGPTKVLTLTLQRPGGGSAAPTAAALTAASDTGISVVDGVTRLGTVTVSGAAATGQQVQVFVDGAPVKSVPAVAGTFSARLSLSEGAHTVTAAYDGQQPLAEPVTVQVDSTAPVVSEPRVDAGVAGGRLTGTVSWSAPGAAAVTAQVRHGQGTFVPLALPSAHATRVQHRLVSTDGYRFRVRATDAAGNASGWAATSVRASVVQDRSERVRYDGHWVRRTSPQASGHRVRSSAVRGATATIRTTAEKVDVVAPTGPSRGRLAVLVDGRRVCTVDLYSARRRPRQTVATLHGLSSGKASVVQIRVLGSKRHASGGSRVTLDAFLLTR